MINKNFDIVPIKDIVNSWNYDILNGQKVPHRVSAPVLREIDDQIYLAAFVFPCNKEQLISEKIERPNMWIIANIKTGEIVERYSCAKKDFSNYTYYELYDISPKKLPPVPSNYWETIYSTLDIVREQYITTGQLNVLLYTNYLFHVLRQTPEAYKVFYKDLSFINTEKI